MRQSDDIVFDRNTVEFVTVAAEYCAYVEQCSGKPRSEFTGTMLKLLPLLYLKGELLPQGSPQGEEDSLQEFVTESDYEVVRLTLSETMGAYDDYLEVFVSEMKYSDTPIRKTISEDLADIYQDIKNFVCLFKTGMHPIMNDATIQCRENFVHYWGQTLVNTLRALHDVHHHSTDDKENHDDNAADDNEEGETSKCID